MMTVTIPVSLEKSSFTFFNQHRLIPHAMGHTLQNQQTPFVAFPPLWIATNFILTQKKDEPSLARRVSMMQI